jgi:hypothetical protein
MSRDKFRLFITDTTTFVANKIVIITGIMINNVFEMYIHKTWIHYTLYFSEKDRWWNYSKKITKFTYTQYAQMILYH